MQLAERRSHTRIPRQLAVRVGGGSAEWLTTRDVSSTGGFVLCDELRRAGEMVELHIRGTSGSFIIMRALVARVVGVGAAEPGMGVIWLDARSSQLTDLLGLLHDVLGLPQAVVHDVVGGRYTFEAAQRVGRAGSVRAGPTPVEAPQRSAKLPSVAHEPTEVHGFRSAIAEAAGRTSNVSMRGARRGSGVRRGDSGVRRASEAHGKGAMRAPTPGAQQSVPEPPPATGPAKSPLRISDPPLARDRHAERLTVRSTDPAVANPVRTLVSPPTLPARSPTPGATAAVSATAHPATTGATVPAGGGEASQPLLRRLLSLTDKLRRSKSDEPSLGRFAVSPGGRFYHPGEGAIPDEATQAATRQPGAGPAKGEDLP